MDRDAQDPGACHSGVSGLLGFFGGLGFGFDLHVAELFGVEDVAAEIALDELGVFIARNDAHTGVFAALGALRMRSGGHGLVAYRAYGCARGRGWIF